MIGENTQSMLTFGLHTHIGKHTHMPKKKKKVEMGRPNRLQPCSGGLRVALRNLGLPCVLSVQICVGW